MSGTHRSGERSAPPAQESTPRVSVRFERGRASLSFAQPLAFAGGRLEVLDVDVGAMPRSVDLSRGWRGLRHRRGVATRVRVALHLDALVARVPGMTLVGPTASGFLVTLARAHGHVAFELRPSRRGVDLAFGVTDARAALDGPRPPTAEALSMAVELGASFDPERGVLVLSDPLLEALTEALVPHGIRVPLVETHRRADPEIRGGDLVLGLALDEASEPRAALLDTDRALAPAIAALAEGALDHALELLRGRTEPGAEALRDELLLEFGDAPAAVLDARGAALALRRALRIGRLDEIAQAARVLDGHERAAAVAVDGLLTAAERARSVDPAVEADLLGRALARAPDDPRVLATVAPLPGPAEIGPLLRTLERSAALRSRDVAVQWSAIGRLRARVGDHAGAVVAYERAVRAAPGDAALLEGLAVALEARGSADAAARAWADAADRRTKSGDTIGAARAFLAVARLDEARGRPHEALGSARSARAFAQGALAAEVEGVVARLALGLGEPSALASAERALVTLADQGDASARDAVAGELAAALSRRPSRPLLEALARLWPDHPSLAERRDALDRAAFAEIEASPAAERADVARRLSERLRAEGRIGDAALALVRTGELLSDAATLRAAVDLAEHSGDAQVLEHVVERALAVVGDGPARAALERRLPPRA